MSNPDRPVPEVQDNAVNTASPWVARWSHLAPPGASVLDIACGGGRHLEWFARRGHAVTGIDRDTEAARQRVSSAELITADIEAGPWPLAPVPSSNGEDLPTTRRFGLVVVTNYLWRPLMPQIMDSVAPGGVLIYETFAIGNETVGRPRRPEFLLQPGELLRACADWHIVAYENGTLSTPVRFVQRIAAVRKAAVNAFDDPVPAYALSLKSNL